MKDLYGSLDEKKKRKKRKKAGSESSKESSLRDWFGRKGAKGKKKGWVDCNAPDGKGGYKSCGRSSGEKRKKYPACRPTPSACKERGKGKSWGKKAKKKSKKNEELYMDLENLIKEELESVLDEGFFDFLKSDQTKAREDLIRRGEDIINSHRNSRRGLAPPINEPTAELASNFLYGYILPFKQKYPEDTQFQNFYRGYVDSMTRAIYADEPPDIKKRFGQPEEDMRVSADVAARAAARAEEVAAGLQRAKQRDASQVDTDVLRGRQRRGAQQAKQDANRRRRQRARTNVRRGFDAGLVDYSDTLEEIVQEELEAVLDEKRKKKGKKKKKKKGGKKDACYHKVKSRYKVWPSAYASGALVKCRKVGAKNWGNSKKESVEIDVQNELELILQENVFNKLKSAFGGGSKNNQNDDPAKWTGRKIANYWVEKAGGMAGYLNYVDVLQQSEQKGDEGPFQNVPDWLTPKLARDHAAKIATQLNQPVTDVSQINSKEVQALGQALQAELNEGKKTDLKTQIVAVLKKEGGAAGMKDLKDKTDGSKEEISKEIDAADNIKVSEHGDVILVDGLDEAGCGTDRDDKAAKRVKVTVREELQAVLDEKKKKKKKKSAKDRMKCNSSRRIRKGEPGHGKKKFVVKACEGGTEKIIRYGDANMEIKKDSPARRKSFRARHNCKNPGSKLKARYWSCKKW